MSTRYDFADQTAIITGGTRGLGRGMAEAFLAAGGRVVATYGKDTAAAEAFRDALPDDATRARLQLAQLDCADHAAVEAFFRELDAAGTKPQVLVNNAGIRRDQPLAMMSLDDWNAVIHTNLTGTYVMCKFGVQAMVRQRYGRIINITSPASWFGFNGQANYSASKAGQIGLMRSLSKEVAKRGITVNCVSPGFIETALIADVDPKVLEEHKAMVPLRRFGTPADVANAVLFLASKEAGYITGTTLEVSGGL
ncbi:MAG: 3-oxoacyl-ACP reductase FabG [Planctomycetota bacterium]